MERINIHKNKAKFAAVMTLLIFAISSAIVALPSAAGHTPPWNIKTFTYISASPSPIGVNQETLVIMWLDQGPPTADGPYGDRWTFSLEITSPDSTKQTIPAIKSDPVGSAAYLFTPTKVGTYTFVASFQQQVITNIPSNPNPPSYPGNLVYINDTFLASKSEPFNLIVQQSQIQSQQETPLPNEYWTRPINGANRDWSQIAGNWLGSAAQLERINSYSTGPESAHIMWTRPIWAGGIMDGRYGDTTYYDGNNYEHFYTEPIVVDGVFYYNVEAPPRYGWYAVDLYTGETLYFKNTTGPVEAITGLYSGFDYSGAIRQGKLAFGQIYDYQSPNQHGGFPYLWSTNAAVADTWLMYDAFTGNYICSVNKVGSAGTALYGKDGSILRYNIVGTGASKRLTVWNTSTAILAGENRWTGQYVGNIQWMWRPYLNYTYNGQYGYSLNVSIPNVAGSIRQVVEDKYVIGGSTETEFNTGLTQYASNIVRGTMWALDLTPGQEGRLLWNYSYTTPAASTNHTSSYGLVAGPLVYSEYGVFLFREGVSRKWYGYSLETGKQLWASESMPSWDYYSQTMHAVYEGKLLAYGYGGQLRAFDIKTGNVLWTYNTGSGGFETYYEQVPLMNHVIADGKIYLISTEHSPSKPLRRDAQIWCVDIDSGNLLWKILSWGRQPIIADGYLLDIDYFDNQLYCYGKGPSAITVTAPDVGVAQGNSVLIQGTVTDVSAGTRSTELAARFPKGVPAVADASMSAWMEYLYKQQVKPTNASGVPVHLTAIDPNNNIQDIGTAISDAKGIYMISWTPPVPGLYKVTATFEGSRSYYRSEAETGFVVSEAAKAAPTSTQTPTITQPPTGTTTPIQTASPSTTTAPPPTSEAPTTTYIAIGAAVIIVVAAAAALVLRRRKK